ncbi:vps901 [[Candida] subhashii]|uniref:Vps901 n=1 Tax=[Candida] subhashii TaxID=561895 RepID=A0A8J5V1B1_9ASCO|nr:vps901 [[Candida] subhashii]KAG7664264.1 vps901 [[Candida] subhashii]
MAFNGLPSFNTIISKSTPTTSTTNENTTSCTPPSTTSSATTTTPANAIVTTGTGNIGGSESPQFTSPTSASVPKSPFLKGIFMKGSIGESTTSASNGQSVTAASVAAPVVGVTLGDETGLSNSNQKKSTSRTDLIGLFDKFDLSANNNKSDGNDMGDDQAEAIDQEDELRDIKSPTQMKEESSHQHVCEKDKDKEKEHIEKEKEDDDTIDSEITEPDQQPQTKEKNSAAFMSIQPYFPPEEENASTATPSLNGSDIQLNQQREPEEEERPKKEIDHSENLIDISDDDENGVANNEKQPQVDVTHSPAPEIITSDTISTKASGSDEGILDITGDEDDESGVEEFQLKQDEQVQQDIPHSELESPTHLTKLDKAKSHVSPSEQYQQSHRPFDFHNFLSQLRKKSADPVVRYIRSFLGSYSRQGHTFSATQRIKIIIDFKRFMNEKFSIYEPFASMDNIDLENSREGLEKLIMNRLYVLCFPPEVLKSSITHMPESYRQDLIQDEEFGLQLEKFSWINGSHLDIDMDAFLVTKNIKEDQNFLDYATSELNKINNYRAPRDKIICILNCCKIIFSYLKITNKETNADAFVPLLILVIFKAKTPNLISNIHYIESFRGEEWLSHGETSYYLSSIQGAIGFIQNLNIGDLTISESEYDAHMEAWEAQRKQIELQQQEQQQRQQQINDNSLLLHPQAQPIFAKTNSMRQAPSGEFQSGLSPSSVLLSSAEIFTKSISNLWTSPSPQPQQQEEEESDAEALHQQAEEVPNPNEQYQPAAPAEDEIDQELLKSTYKTLKEIFPTLDKNILKDVIFINRGNVDTSIDACLQLVEDD